MSLPINPIAAILVANGQGETAVSNPKRKAVSAGAVLLHLVYFSFLYVIYNFISRKMENANTALFRGCLSLPAQKDRHHYDNNEPIF